MAVLVADIVWGVRRILGDTPAEYIATSDPGTASAGASDTFTVADGYLFNVTNWARLVGVDLSTYTDLLAFRTRVAARPAVIEAMRAEGLIK